MFTDDMLETILMHKDMRGIPIGIQTTVLNVCERVLAEYGYDFVEEEKKNATVLKS